MRTHAPIPVFMDGQLVYPQTMQAIVSHGEDRLHRRLEACSLESTGVVRCAIDHDALRRREVVITDLCVVVPSGQVLDTAAGITLPSRRAEALTPGGPPARVWVGLAREREGGANLAEEGSAEARFVREERSLADWSSGQRRVDICVARPNVQLRVGGDGGDDFDGVAVAELLCDGDGRVRCADDFIPRVLHCAAAPALMHRLDALLAQAQSRCDELLHHWSLSRGAPAALTALDVLVKAAHAALSGVVPPLRAMRRSASRLSPFTLHMQLLQIAGTMAALTGDEAPLEELSMYDPEDLRRTFVPLCERISALLRRSVYDNYVCTPFSPIRGDRRAFELQFDDPRIAMAGEYLLRMHFSDEHGRVILNQDRQIDLFMRQAKFGAPDQLEDMRLYNIGGVRLETVRSIPGLPVHSGCGYYRLNREDKRFQAVLAQRRAVLRVPDGLEMPESPRPHFALIAVLNLG